MNQYESFAAIYDLLMEETPYDKWLKIITDILHKDGIDDGLILDLGCGTGVFTRMMADCGYDMTGVDASADMLTEARENNGDRNILYLCQDMREFELYGTMRAIISTCDCLNYMITEEDLTQVFKLANNYLDPGGLFIFDMNTAHKFKALLGNNTYAESFEGAAYIWDNWFDEDTGINSYELTIFLEDEDGRYDRFDELHEERAYRMDTVIRCAQAAGLKFESAVDAETYAEPTEETERILFVMREQGK